MTTHPLSQDCATELQSAITTEISKEITRKESTPRKETRTSSGSQLGGTLWFIGWLFTIGFVKLVWWKALLGVVLWPYFLGDALR